MRTRQLSKEDFLATSRGKMKDVSDAGDAVVDIWPYVVEVARGLEISIYAVQQQLVEKVYRDEDGRYDHVLIPYGIRNVFLTVIVDRNSKEIYGHHLLDLNEEYEVGYETV